MKKTRKAIASLAMVSMVLTTVPFNALAADVPLRLAGNTAADTAVEISKQTGWSGAAILASSETYGMADALAAGPLAFYLKAPILLTGNSNTLDAATKTELSRLNVSTVYVTSGTAVIPQAILNEITAMGIAVVPLGGYDRAETSVNIAKRMSGVTKVAVANSIPDALSIAAIASAANQPILLVDKDNVSSSVTDYVANNAITAADVIGGTGIISDSTANQFPNATRHFGYTAYDTNNQVIQNFADALEFDIVYTANGETAIDALSGAPLAAQTNSPIILTNGKEVPAAAAFVAGRLGTEGQVTALGGTAVISESIRQGIATGNVPGDIGPLAVTSITANTVSSIKVVFNKAPQNTSSINFEVSQGQQESIVLSTEWNDAKTEAVLKRSSKFVEGTYAVSVKNDGVEMQNSSVTFTAQKVAKIDIYSKVLGVVNHSKWDPPQRGYASYRILDQYGDDITKSALANNVTFQTGVGSIEAKNGLITVTPTSNLNLLTFTAGVVITANDTSSGVSATQTLTVTSKVGTLSDFQLIRLTNTNGKTEVVAGDTTQVFYIEYEALDIGGEPTTNYTLVKEGLILSGDNEDELITSSPYVEAKLVQDPADSNTALIEVKAKTTDELLLVDMPLVITAMSWAGSSSQLTSTLRKQAQVDTISLYAPSESIASGESKKIPFAAYDQNGDPITKYSELYGYVTLTGAYWYEEADGTGSIKNTAKTVSATSSTSLPHTISASTKTGKWSTITINIQKPVKADNLLLNSSILISALQQGGAYQYADMGWDKGGFIVRDQYDREIDMTKLEYENYKIRATSSNASVIAVGLDENAASSTVDFDAYGDSIYIKSAGVGSTTVRFELIDTSDGNKVIDTKSQTFTSLKNDDIKSYMIDQLTSSIYMMNEVAGSSGYDRITKQEDEFKARPRVYGRTSSGGKVVLAGRPIISAGSDNDDFTVYDATKGWPALVSADANAEAAAEATAAAEAARVAADDAADLVDSAATALTEAEKADADATTALAAAEEADSAAKAALAAAEAAAEADIAVAATALTNAKAADADAKAALTAAKTADTTAKAALTNATAADDVALAKWETAKENAAEAAEAAEDNPTATATSLVISTADAAAAAKKAAEATAAAVAKADADANAAADVSAAATTKAETAADALVDAEAAAKAAAADVDAAKAAAEVAAADLAAATTKAKTAADALVAAEADAAAKAAAYDTAKAAYDSAAAKAAAYSTVKIPYDEIRIVANKLKSESLTESESIISVLVMSHDSKIYNLTTTVTSSKTRPSAASIKIGVATEKFGIQRDENEITLDLNYYKKAGGWTWTSLAKYNYSTGAETEKSVYFAPIDQYGTQGWTMSGFYVTASGGNGANSAAQGDYVLNATTGGWTTFNPVAGDWLRISATTNSGKTETIRVTFVGTSSTP